MKKILIFTTLIFPTILALMIFFGVPRAVLAQTATNTNYCHYNIETSTDSTCISGIGCRKVTDTCQGAWGCMTPFGCSAPALSCPNTANCVWYTEGETPWATNPLSTGKLTYTHQEPVPFPPHPHPECQHDPAPISCFYDLAVIYQSNLWSEELEHINAYNNAVYIYEDAVGNWKANAEQGRTPPRPLPPDPNDFVVGTPMMNYYTLKNESSYGSDPRALTPPVPTDQALKIFDSVYQAMLNKIAANPTAYYNERFAPNASSTGQFLANGQTNLTVYVGDTINYTWKGPAGYIYSSTYTSDAPDNCPGSAQTSGAAKPWVANTEQGSTSAQVQQCQAGRTYTITYTAKTPSNEIKYQGSVVVQVLNQKPPSFLANNQTNLTAYVGDTINYTWQGPKGDGYTYSSTYTADAPDCPGGITKPGEVKPWVANTVQGSTSAQVQQCQAGRTYTITYVAKDSSQKVVYQSFIVVKVAVGSKPATQYNPLDASTYTGPTTIFGVTDKNQNIQAQTQIQNQNQTQNVQIQNIQNQNIQNQNQTGSNQNSLTNSLSDIISKINSILESAKNLSQEDQDIISKAIQTVLGTLQNLITSLIQKTTQTNNNNNINSNISLLANNQTNLTVYVGDTINYTWQGPSGSGYIYSSTYTSDAPDNCPGSAQTSGAAKPWVANTEQGSTSAQVQQCQAGRTYTITYMAKDSVGTTIAQTSIIVKVANNQFVKEANNQFVKAANNQSQINNKDKIGVYFWGGNLQSSSNYLQDGINLAKRIGTKTVRIAISSKDMLLYKLSNQCSSDSLAQMAKNFENLFKDSQFDTIIITAYDQTGLSCSGKKYLDPSFYTSENIQKMKQEYKDLANYLGQNFPNKKFIIANWESDNDIYCGAAYGFNPSGNQCDYRNSIEAFKKFISVRSEAIKESNQPNVFSGVEFNIVNYLKDNNLPSTLYDVIPYVPADYYLYSSYESINNLYKDNGINLLNSDISKIKQVLLNSGKNQNNLIIGEYGFGSGDNEQNKNLLSKATETFLNDGSIQYAIIWNLLNSGGSFGLFDEQGNFTSQGDYIRQVLEENNQ